MWNSWVTKFDDIVTTAFSGLAGGLTVGHACASVTTELLSLQLYSLPGILFTIQFDRKLLERENSLFKRLICLVDFCLQTTLWNILYFDQGSEMQVNGATQLIMLKKKNLELKINHMLQDSIINCIPLKNM